MTRPRAKIAATRVDDRELWSPPPPPTKTQRRPWWSVLRWVLIVIAVYLMVFVVFQLSLVGLGALSRTMGNDPRAEAAGLPEIKNLRLVDDHLWGGGAQPDDRAYQDLAAAGVETVIDFRTGGLNDPIVDDPESIRSLGMERHHLPITDGHAPDAETMRRFLEIVDESDGPVFVHCGGGVGRSTEMIAVYLASKDENPSVMQQLAVGPPTLEQIAFVNGLGADDPASRPSRSVWATSRYVLDLPRPIFSWFSRLL